MRRVAQVTIDITPGLPWWFGIAVIVVTALAVIGIVQLAADVIAQARIKNAREREARWRGPQTLAAICAGVAAAVLVGFNVQPIWYIFNPDLQPPTVNAQEVRDEFADQGAASLELRDTDPPNSLVMLDEDAWNEERPLEHLLACDAGQHPQAGHYPAYDDFNWDLPVQYSADGETVGAMLERTVADGACTFELVPVDA
ncbi:MAG: hypothetical protein ACTIKK_00610 [Agrococcus casei]|uniref:hypothetical protein n=1 Tax=Agrococcus casei TaxID=343512 RepID=UPI003F90CAF2